VPEVAASGDYRLQRIWITFPSGRPTVNYYMESDFQDRLVFHIENRKHFENPKMKSIRELR
jgi:hypothetical protein